MSSQQKEHDMADQSKQRLLHRLSKDPPKVDQVFLNAKQVKDWKIV